jgi:hypothetical protein
MKNDDLYEMDGTLAGGDGRFYEWVMAIADGVVEVAMCLAVIGMATALVFLVWG